MWKGILWIRHPGTVSIRQIPEQILRGQAEAPCGEAVRDAGGKEPLANVGRAIMASWGQNGWGQQQQSGGFSSNPYGQWQQVARA